MSIQRIKGVFLDGRQPGDGQLDAVPLGAGETHQFTAEVVVVDEDGLVVESPEIDTTVTWQIRHWVPKAGFRDREKPWNPAGLDPTGTGNIGTITSGGLYTAPAEIEPFWRNVGGILVYAIANFESDALYKFTGADGLDKTLEVSPKLPEGTFVTRENKRLRYCIFGNRGVDFV